MVCIRPLVVLSNLLLGAALSIVARPAAACSCRSSRLLSPRASSTNVPLNAVVVFETSVNQPALYDLDRNIAVPITIEPFTGVSRFWLIRPNVTLEPNTTFEVRVPPPILSSTIARFTTGTTTDDEPPSYDGFISFGADTIEPPGDSCRTSCWPINGLFLRLRFDYLPPPADTSLLLLETRVAEATTVNTVPLFLYPDDAEWPRGTMNSSCSIGMPSFGTDEPICARIVAFDMAGHRSSATPEICTRSAACQPPPPAAFCDWTNECKPLGGGDAGADADAATDADPPVVPPVVSNDDTVNGCSLPTGAPSPDSRVAMIVALAAAAAFARRRS